MLKSHSIRIFLTSCIFLLIVIYAGCSSESSRNPVFSVGDESPDLSTVNESTSNLPNGISVPAIFGAYEVNLDTASLTGEASPLRVSGTLGDSFNVDITPFLTVTPCSDCLRISSMSLDGNYLNVDFQTRHPFKPENRYDLHVFDLRGIVVTGDNTREFASIPLDPDGDGNYSAAKGNVDFLVNADGYTSFYDAVVEQYLGRIYEGNICPFKNLWMNPTIIPPGSNYDPKVNPQNGFTDLQNASGYNVFPMGGSFENSLSTTSYRFDFGSLDQISFLFILEASYAHTALKPDRKNPRYFLPEFNRKDAWRVEAEVFNNNLYANDWSSTAFVRITAMDWQAGRIPAPAWNYGTSDLTYTRYASDVREVLIDIPGILTNPLSQNLSNLKSGDGSYGAPYTWETGFSNQASAGSGEYWGIAAVRDQLEGSANTPWGINGDITSPVKLKDITTYQSFKVVINAPPVVDIADDDPDDQVNTGGYVNFKPGDTTRDPDGEIVSYEYDFDFDGFNFVADDIQISGDPDFGEPVKHQFVNAGVTDILVKVALRATDNGTPTLRAVDFAEFTVHPETGVYLYEDFETTIGSALPVGWGITGRIGDAYYLGTNGGGCEDTGWRWGVTINASQGETGQSHFLNEDGFIHPTGDLTYTYQNRATIVCTPEFEVPTRGAIIRIRHWYDFTITNIDISRRYRDGGLPILSIANPGAITWEDFCDPEPESHHPKRSLPVIAGPVGYEYVSPFAAGGHPLRGWACHTGDSGGWITSSYSISNMYAGQSVRVGFLFGSDDIERDTLSDCDPRALAEARPGWRINWVSIQEN